MNSLSSDRRERLARRFARAWSGAGASGSSVATFEALLVAYAEPQRHYHTLEHIEQCLAWLDWTWSRAERPCEVELALWFHDVVYDPRRSDNEAESAAWAWSRLTAAGAPERAPQRIAALILATSGHSASDGDAALMVDIDLAILGAGEDEFERFERAIRDEYRAFDDLAYARGRARVLAKLAAREPLYSTPWIAAELERPARANLQRSLRRWQAADARAAAHA